MTQADTSRAQIADDEIDLGRLLGLLLDHRWWIIGITSFFAIVGIAYALLATPIYQSNALLQIEKKTSGSSLLLGDMSEMFGEGSEVAAEIELLKSRLVIGNTVDDLQLTTQVTPNYFPLVGRGLARLLGQPEPQVVVSRFEVPAELVGESWRLTVKEDGRYTITYDDLSFDGTIGELLSDAGLELLVTDMDAEVGQKFTLSKSGRLRKINALKSSLSVSEVGKQTGVLSLAMEGADRDYIQQVVEHISQNYLQQNVMRNTEEAEKSLAFLEEQLPQILKDLNESELNLNSYRQEHDSVDLSLEAKAALDTMVEIEKQLNDLTFKEAELQQRFTRRHPSYISLLDKRETLNKTKERINASIKKLPKTQQEILRLTRDVEVDQQIYVQLLNKQQELNILKAGTIGNVRIVDEAVVEPLPVKPKRKLVVLIATLLGGMLSVGLVLLRAALHRGIESPEQLEEIGISVYAAIPVSQAQKEVEQRLKKKQRPPIEESLLALKDPADLAMEALRSLRTSLHFAMLEAENNIVLITGSAPEIGKSFICANLSAALAMGDKKVLAIDADLRKGHLQHLLGQPNKTGLTEYLAGQASLDNVIKNIPFKGLDFISRGEVPPNPSELLMHPRLAELLQWASQNYDFVLVDSAPILAVTDAAIVGQHVGTSLLVARHGVTAVKEVEVAIRRFAQNNVKIKGVLLNAVEKRSSGYYGNYGYYQYQYDKA